MSAQALSTAVDWICLIAALGSIVAYVMALLRNRPYLRPMNSLGLLLIGGALLGAPTVIGPSVPPEKTLSVLWVVGLLVASAVFQTISAFRRRKPRAGDAPKPA